MTLSINGDNNLQALSDKHFTTKCPHCNTKSGLSLVSAPRFEYMHRFKSEWVGFVYRCDACNQPVFLKSRVISLANPVSFDENMVEIERPAESFELQHLPDEVAEDFKEALVCYSNSCWNAFAGLCNRFSVICLGARFLRRTPIGQVQILPASQPLLVNLSQDGRGQSQDRGFIREGPDHSGVRRRISLLTRSSVLTVRILRWVRRAKR